MNVYVVWVSDQGRTVASEHRLFVRASYGCDAQAWAERHGWHVMSVDVAQSIPAAIHDSDIHLSWVD